MYRNAQSDADRPAGSDERYRAHRPRPAAVLGLIALTGMIVLILAVGWINILQYKEAPLEATNALTAAEVRGVYTVYLYVIPVFIAINLLLAFGLWKLWDWARVAAILLYGMVAAASLCGISYSGVIDWATIVRLGIAALFITLLVVKPVASEFE